MAKSTDRDITLLSALSEPARLSIVRQLACQSEVCACDFTCCADLSQPTVSHHLRVLREAGVVRGERRGTWIWYCLEPWVAERLAALAAELVPGRAQTVASLAGGRSPRSRRQRELAVVELPRA